MNKENTIEKTEQDVQEQVQEQEQEQVQEQEQDVQDIVLIAIEKDFEQGLITEQEKQNKRLEHFEKLFQESCDKFEQANIKFKQAQEKLEQANIKFKQNKLDKNKQELEQAEQELEQAKSSFENAWQEKEQAKSIYEQEQNESSVFYAFEKVLEKIKTGREYRDNKKALESDLLTYALFILRKYKNLNNLNRTLKVLKYAGVVREYLDSIGVFCSHNAKTDVLKVIKDSDGAFITSSDESFEKFVQTLPLFKNFEKAKKESKKNFEKSLKNLFKNMNEKEIRNIFEQFIKGFKKS